MRNKPLNDDGAMQFVRQFCLPDGAQCEGGESPCANFAYFLNPKETIPHVVCLSTLRLKETSSKR